MLSNEFKTELEDIYNELKLVWDKDNKRAALLKELRDLLNNQTTD